MARIAGVDLPRDKKVEIGLTYIFGIGRHSAQDIIQKAGIDASLDNRFLVLVLWLLVALGGGYALVDLPIDAVPDVTNVQVQILTNSPGLAPEEVEKFVTFPVETAMSGLPKIEEIRSISRFGSKRRWRFLPG